MNRVNSRWYLEYLAASWKSFWLGGGFFLLQPTPFYLPRSLFHLNNFQSQMCVYIRMHFCAVNFFHLFVSFMIQLAELYASWRNYVTNVAQRVHTQAFTCPCMACSKNLFSIGIAIIRTSTPKEIFKEGENQGKGWMHKSFELFEEFQGILEIPWSLNEK